jgi:hypothetical protein
MAKLNDIPRKEFFKVPEGYFDELPSRIQSKLATPLSNTGFTFVSRYGLRYAVPVVLVVIGVFYFLEPRPDVDSMLSSVETAELINYLNESGLTTEELLENIDFNIGEVQAIENEVYSLHDYAVDDEILDLELNTF